MAISAAFPRAAVHPWPMDKIPDPEVPERPTRRRFSGAYKLAILHEPDQASEPGAKGAIMRREGLYSSSITEVAKAARRGRLGSPGPSAWTTSGRRLDQRLRGRYRKTSARAFSTSSTANASWMPPRRRPMPLSSTRSATSPANGPCTASSRLPAQQNVELHSAASFVVDTNSGRGRPRTSI